MRAWGLREPKEILVIVVGLHGQSSLCNGPKPETNETLQYKEKVGGGGDPLAT